MSVQTYPLQKQRVLLLMEALKIETQADLADQIKQSPRQLRRWLNHETDICAEDLVALASALKTSTDYLTGKTDAPLVSAEDVGLTDLELALVVAARTGRREELLTLLLDLERRQGATGE